MSKVPQGLRPDPKTPAALAYEPDNANSSPAPRCSTMGSNVGSVRLAAVIFLSVFLIDVACPVSVVEDSLWDVVTAQELFSHGDARLK